MESIGKLEFVGNFLPESVMVFWNGESKTLSAPFEDGVLLLEKDGKAWFEGSGSVLAGAAGEVEAVEETAEGYRLTLRCTNQLTCVLEPLQGVRTAPGEKVRKGQNIGVPVAVGQTCRVCMTVTDGGEAVAAETWLR